MEREFEGRTALVTGGAMGIGGAVAELLASRGANVVILDRAKAEAESLAQKLGVNAIAIAADVASTDEVKAAVDKCVERFGGLDIVSNNAGIQRYGTVETTTEAGWDEVMNVNLKSIYLVCHHAIGYLKARKGAVVNMASPRCRRLPRSAVLPPTLPASTR
jgi:NAD(P)-dependent dehydrogenase (short-subunit alcohol dehydrogenase family)